MPRFIICRAVAISLLGFSSTLSVAQDAKWGSADEAQSIIAMEAAWISQVCAPQPDLSFIADDFKGTRRNGTRYGRDIATTGPDKSKPTSRDCRIGDVDVRFFSDSAAVAYGSEGWINIAADATEVKFCEAWSDVWVKRDGQWKLVAAQDNVVPCEQWWPTLRGLRTVLPNYKE
jgi:hypothetical protein